MEDRFSDSRRMGLRDELISRRNPTLNDQMAKAAEDWLADYLGVRRNPVHGPDHWDVVSPKGIKIDVKWTPYLPGTRYAKGGVGYPFLMVQMWKPLRADVYALIMGPTVDDFDKWSWADGWRTVEDMKKAPDLDDGQRRKTSRASAPVRGYGFDYLYPLDELL